MARRRTTPKAESEAKPKSKVAALCQTSPPQRLSPLQRLELLAARDALEEDRLAQTGDTKGQLGKAIKRVEMCLASGNIEHLTEADEEWGGADFDVKWGDAWSAVGGAGHRDLSRQRQKQSQQIAYSLVMKHPIAKRIVSDICDHIGDGRQWAVIAKDPLVQQVIDEFWFHPTNAFPKRLKRRVWQLLVLGEQVYPVGLNDTTGIIQLGYIDPANVTTVKPLPGNAELLDTLTYTSGAGESPGGTTKNIIRQEADGSWRAAKGDVFFFPLERASNATRGTGILLSLLDYLDIYDQALFTVAERQALLNAHIWDVTLEGMDEGQIQEWLAKQPATPKPGTMRAHNEQVTWSVVTPELEANDQDKSLQTILQAICAGSGFPEHWLGRSSDTNRATARSLTFPVRFRLRGLQNEIVTILETMLDCQLYLAREKKHVIGNVPPENLTYEIRPPELGAEDINEVAEAALKVTQMLVVAEDRGYLTKDQARVFFGLALESFGLKTPSQMAGAGQEEATTESYADAMYEELAQE